nr:non-specific lipid-transfer protein 2 [Ipomoea trifida]
MKAFNLMILAVMVLVLSTETQLSWAACDVQQLSPCLSAITSNTKPSQLCCHSLIQQKPCFCQYLKNPTLKNYVNSPAAKKAAKTCKSGGTRSRVLDFPVLSPLVNPAAERMLAPAAEGADGNDDGTVNASFSLDLLQELQSMITNEELTSSALMFSMDLLQERKATSKESSTLLEFFTDLLHEVQLKTATRGLTSTLLEISTDLLQTYTRSVQLPTDHGESQQNHIIHTPQPSIDNNPSADHSDEQMTADDAYGSISTNAADDANNLPDQKEKDHMFNDDLGAHTALAIF